MPASPSTVCGGFMPPAVSGGLIKAFKPLEKLKDLGGPHTLSQLKALAAGAWRKPLLGVDITPGSVRIVQLSTGQAAPQQTASGETASAKTSPQQTRPASYRLDGYAIHPLPAGAVVEKNIIHIAAVADAVTKAVAALQPESKDAAVAVAGPAVSTKTIQMDASLNDAELEDRIMREAGRHIPYRLEDVAIDFERRPAAGPGQPSATSSVSFEPSTGNRRPTTARGPRAEVLLAACRREAVEARVAALELGGLSVRVVDIEVFVMERIYRLLAERLGQSVDGPVAMVDVASESSLASESPSALVALNILLGGRSVYTQERPVDDCDTAALVAHTERGLQAFYQAFYQSIDETAPHEPVQRIVLAGHFGDGSGDGSGAAGGAVGGAKESAEKLPDLAAALDAALHIPVAVANPFADFELGPAVDPVLLKRDAPALLLACGLAMRRAP